MSWQMFFGVSLVICITLKYALEILADAKHKSLIVGALIVISIFASLVMRANLLALVYLAAFFGIMIAEKISPRRKYEFSSGQNVKFASYHVFRMAVAVVCAALLIPPIKSVLPTLPWNFTSLEVPILLQGLVFFALVDLKEYILHRAGHHFDFLWRFHKVHHSSVEITSLAWAPTHFIEFVAFRLISTVLIGSILHVNSDVILYTNMFFFIVAGPFVHANLSLPKDGTSPLWSKIINSPLLHGHHHTVEGMRSNYGFSFALWDRMFGTLHTPKTLSGEFGIGDSNFSSMGIVADQFVPLLPNSWLKKRTDEVKIEKFEKVENDTSSKSRAS